MSAKRKKRRERKLLRQHRVEPKRFWAPPGELQEVEQPERLAYSRKQAAQALGVSISTIDRRVVPSLNTVKTPWGQRLIPAAELERFLHQHLQPPHEPGERGSAGRPPTLPRPVVERIRLQYTRGSGLAEIARALNDDRVPTAHGGRQWWPSTVRDVLVRASPLTSAEPRDRAA
jgi:Recombinase